jgi:hypothetical protein
MRRQLQDLAGNGKIYVAKVFQDLPSFMKDLDLAWPAT